MPIMISIEPYFVCELHLKKIHMILLHTSAIPRLTELKKRIIKKNV